MTPRLLTVGVASLLVAACATSPSGGPFGSGGLPGGPSVPAQPAPPTLGAEQRRLSQLFEGTPVVFEMQRDGSLKVTVPVAYSFDKGRYVVKPPLGKVLDLLARSQRDTGSRFLVSAPADTPARGGTLATERASSARDYLVGRGVRATRFSIAALTSGDAVVIVIADPSAG